ncbi:MAG: hypothetical protein IT311_12195 [Anaerolineales bacterium]|nr:hypothetical protein [Anaerolineales bacterium]MCZ2123724.1 hypothetical protein [Anaerolineales bacterium]
MKKILSLFCLLPLLLGCAPASASAIGTNCDSLQPTNGDVQYALDFGNALFTEAVWERSYTVRELDVIVNRVHRSALALVDISLLLFCNDNGTDDIELFYNNQTVQEGFSNYENAVIVNSCQKDNLLLYEVTGSADGVDYSIHQWIRTLSKTRLLNVVAVFPKTEAALNEKYSQGLFPELPACK